MVGLQPSRSLRWSSLDEDYFNTSEQIDTRKYGHVTAAEVTEKLLAIVQLQPLTPVMANASAKRIGEYDLYTSNTYYLMKL